MNNPPSLSKAQVKLDCCSLNMNANLAEKVNLVTSRSNIINFSQIKIK